MTKTLIDSLKRLELQPDWLAGQRLATPLNAAKENAVLLSTVDNLRKGREIIRLTPPLNPDQVWRLWVQNNYQFDRLDGRQIRTLCVSPKTAINPAFIKACEANHDVLQRTTCL